MCPPNVYGTVVKLYGAGTDGHDSYGVEDTVLEVRAPVVARIRHAHIVQSGKISSRLNRREGLFFNRIDIGHGGRFPLLFERAF